jgi:hypothetical protein
MSGWATVHGRGRWERVNRLAQLKAMALRKSVQRRGSDVADTVTGTRNRNEKGFSSPPVRCNSAASCTIS